MKRIILLFLLAGVQLFAQSYYEMKKEAYALYHDGDKKHAFSKVNQFIQEHPQSLQAQNLLAVLYYWSGDLQKSRHLLEGILAHQSFPQAKKLLARIESKQGKTKSYQSIKRANQQAVSNDLTYLLSKIQDNPNDTQNRALLAKYYFKIGAYQKAFDMAHEVLVIDPNDKKMQTITQHLSQKYKLSYSAALENESVVDKNQAKKMLQKLHQEKKYAAFYNLYEALKNSHVVFSQNEYVNILHTAIMLGKYKEAEMLFAKGVLPVNKYTLQVQLLLSKKLHQSVASR